MLSSDAVKATFAPAYGMVCASLTHRGDELLGMRKGLEAYVDTGSTMGIPLLHPWANRLGGFEYEHAGRRVTLEPPDVRLEEHGLPIHGLRSAVRGWEVLEAAPDRLVGAREIRALGGFPFDHRIEVAAELRDTTLALTTTVTATGESAVPICFGYHPYLRLPGVPRAEWDITAPVGERLEVDERRIPTGERAPAGDLDGPLGARTFDAPFKVAGGPFAVAGGGRRIEVAFERGYPVVQVFAPETEDVVSFEPMTAPPDALRRSPGAVAPGETFTARFTVAVSPAA